MPLIFSGACRSCGTHVGASDHALGLFQDDGTIAPLRHPCEDHDLQRFGYTFERALRGYRLVSSVDVICRDCRTVHPVHRLRYGSSLAGCGWGAGVFALACGVAWWFGQPVLVMLAGVLFVTTTLIFEAFAWFRARRNTVYRKGAAILAERSRCPTCGGRRRRKLRVVLRMIVRCPICAMPTVPLKVTGVS